MNDQHRPTIAAVHTAKPKRRQANHALIAEAQAEAMEFANNADFWMRVAAAQTVVIFVGVIYTVVNMI